MVPREEELGEDAGAVKEAAGMRSQRSWGTNTLGEVSISAPGQSDPTSAHKLGKEKKKRTLAHNPDIWFAYR